MKKNQGTTSESSTLSTTAGNIGNFNKLNNFEFYAGNENRYVQQNLLCFIG